MARPRGRPKGSKNYDMAYWDKIKNTIHAFYDEYFRPPTMRELHMLGFCSKWPQDRIGCNYTEYLEELGYGDCHGHITIEVLEDDEVVFTGTISEVSEELGLTPKSISRQALRGKYTNDGYEIRVKEFNGKLEGLV